MRFSEASGHKVVSTSTADTVGRVAEFVVDPRARTVVALELRKSAGGDVLRWSDITSFGVDAVTVDGVERLTDLTEEMTPLAGKDHRILGKRVLNSSGDELGKVVDVDFEPGSGEVTSLELDHGPIEGTRLIGIGSYAVIVHAEKSPG